MLKADNLATILRLCVEDLKKREFFAFFAAYHLKRFIISVLRADNLATILRLYVEDLKTCNIFAFFVGYLLRGFIFRQKCELCQF